MENPEKFSSSKEVITFLAETFPACFSLEGEAKPLKVGIFQDLAERLQDEERVSKTLLRSALRHYTNSWRYLHSVKEGAFRVDLDGNQDAAIEKEHADHALQQLEESKAKVAERRKQQAPKANKGKEKGFAKKAPGGFSRPKPGVNGDKPRAPKRPPAQKLTDGDLKAGTEVTVKVGKAPMPAVITEVAKDGVHVQLNTGMVLKVQADNLRLARQKR